MNMNILSPFSPSEIKIFPFVIWSNLNKLNKDYLYYLLTTSSIIGKAFFIVYSLRYIIYLNAS